MTTQSGFIIPATSLGGGQINSLDSLTVAGFRTQTMGDATSEQLRDVSNPVAPAMASSPKSSSAYWLVGILLLLVAAKMASENKNSKLELRHIRISVWNWVFITLLAGSGLVTWKVFQNKFFPKSGLTRVVNAA